MIDGVRSNPARCRIGKSKVSLVKSMAANSPDVVSGALPQVPESKESLDEFYAKIAILRPR